jgi:sec-independent protein translocase protein TatB
MASDFQRQFSDALKEADIDEVKKEISGATSFSNPLEDINKSAEELMGSIDIDDDADIYANKEREIAADVAAPKPVGTPVSPRKTSKGDAILAKKIAAGKKSTAKSGVKSGVKSGAAKTSTAKTSTAKRSTAKTAPAKTAPAKTATAKTSPAKASAVNSAPKSSASKTAAAKKSAAARKPATKSKAKIGSKSA